MGRWYVKAFYDAGLVRIEDLKRLLGDSCQRVSDNIDEDISNLNDGELLMIFKHSSNATPS